jgi:hypothetical protein
MKVSAIGDPVARHAVERLVLTDTPTQENFQHILSSKLHWNGEDVV